MTARGRTLELLESSVGGSVDDAPTPVAVIDLARMEANVRRLGDYADRHAIELWPHTKTHKSTVLGQFQLAAGATGLTVAKPGEAEVFAAAGLQPLLMHFPPVGDQVASRLARVAGEVPLTVALDSLRAADDLSRALSADGAEADVLIELDTGLARTGLADLQGVVALADAIERLPALAVVGISTYPGHLRGALDTIRPGLGQLDAQLRGARDALRAAGFACERISGGSTPTRYLTHETCISELRAGTAIFLDRQSAQSEPELGLDACALTIQATVVSTAVPGRAAIDAGSKTLTSDPHPDGGFGAVVSHPEMMIVALNEEHGYVDIAASAGPVAVGDRLSVVPNHACACVNLHDFVLGVRDGAVETLIEIEARGLVR